MMSPPEEGGIKEARDADTNITISDSTLRKILPPQLKTVIYRYKVMCCCECCIYVKSMHSYPLTWRNFHLKHLKDRSHNAQRIRPGEISSRIFVTYKNYVQPHGCHIYNTAADMAVVTICPCTSENNGV